MKKVSSVELGGLVFQIDGEAFGRLEAYISALENQFQSTEGSEEIIGDIEYRIAEIFQEKIKKGQESIQAKDIDEVILIMGAPKDLDQEDETVISIPEPILNTESSASTAEPETVEAAEETEIPNQESSTNQESAQGKGKNRQDGNKFAGKKRFYRNAENKMLGGVCSGFAAYINMDPLIIRLAFVIGVLAFGISPLVYIVLWVLIPEAKTSSDKLQMRGEQVTIASIEKTIKKEAKELKKKLKGLSGQTDEMIEKAEKSADDFFVETGDFFRRMFRGGAKIIIGLLISVILISIIGSVAAFAGGAGYYSWSIPGFTDYLFSSGWQSMLATIGLSTVVAIPLLVICYKIMRFLLGIKLNTKPLDAILFGCWVIGLGIVIAVTAKVATEFQREVSFTSANTFEPVIGQPLSLELDSYEPRDYFIMKMNNLEVYEDDVIFNNVDLHIGKSDDARYQIETVHHSKGKNKKQATHNAKSISYKPSIDQATISIPDYYRISGSTWRDQKLDVFIKVPEGGALIIDSKLHKLIDDVDMEDKSSSHKIYNKLMVMSDDGLRFK
ncbi:MAG: phage shock protein C [Saprospiraceae bacterium]|jgi:phage shock protein C